MKNIYNEPLEPCGNNMMGNGSWDNQYKCSELGGGVHQICVKDIATSTNQFSLNTGQSNWSDKRNGNHCVCLGAYALYNAKGLSDGKYLKCNAIPNTVFSKNYIKKFASEGNWEEWNGLELDNQIKSGIDNLMSQCYYSANEKQRKELIKNYYRMNKFYNI